MPIRSRPTDYVTANWIRSQFRITDSILLRLVACGKVEVRIQPGFRPLYRVSDVEKSVAKLPVYRPGRDIIGTMAQATKQKGGR